MIRFCRNIVALFKDVCRWLLQLNLFKTVPPSNDPNEIRLQLISTRLFLCSFVASLVSLTIYTSIATFPETIVVEFPTSSQYLHLYTEHPETLLCSCTHIAIDYKEFMEISFDLHQVCSSDFTSEIWINTFLQRIGDPLIIALDFRTTSLYCFQALRSLCSLSNDSITNSLTRFYSDYYVSLHAIPPILFDNQVSSIIQQFQSSTTRQFLSALRITRHVTQANSMLSFTQSNAAMSLVLNETYATSTWRTFGSCSCATNAECVDPSYVYRGATMTVLFEVTGMKTGCYTLESLLQSDLQCFYNQTCLDRFIQSAGNNILGNVVTMNASLVTRFPPKSTVNQIINELMVEQWHKNIFYEKYFNFCRPATCTYKIKKHNHPIYIVTTIIGLIGGLITGLRFIVPYIVRLVRKERRQQPLERVSYQNIRRKLYGTAKYIKEFNLFSSIPPSSDAHEIRNQLISTRIFFIVYIVSLITLLIYTSTITVSMNIIVESPTLQQYSQLHAEYSRTLSCPCSRIATDYGRFLNLSYRLHQVCSSQFISQQWIDSLFSVSASGRAPSIDFRHTGSFTFQALRSLCILVNDSLTNTRNRFYSNRYISMFVTPETLFHSQIQSFIEQFQLSTKREFLSSLQIVQQIIHANYIFSALQTNSIILIDNNTQYLTISEVDYPNCSCIENSSCSVPSALYNSTRSEIFYLVPGIRVGCYILQALLQSDLRCLYDQICLKEWSTFLDENILSNVTALDRTARSRFLSNSPVNDLLGALFIEEWSQSVSHSIYFTECEPMRCEYTIQTRNDILYIVTTIFGLIGGLTTGLQFIAPKVVNVCRKKRTAEVLQDRARPSVYQFARHNIQKLWQTNLFPSTPPSIDPDEIQNQLVSTRLFVLLLTISFFILLVYTLAITVDEIKIVQWPTLGDYSKLYEEHSESLRCPCSSIDIFYENFLEINYTLHQVCSSSFTSKQWISYLQQSWKNRLIINIDFRITGPSMFLTLESFCTQTNNTITHALTRFYASRYISMDVTPRILFLSQMNSAIKEHRTSITREFLSSLRIVRDTIQNNGLLSALMSNAMFGWLPTEPYMLTVSNQYGACYCIIDSKCVIPSNIFMEMSTTILYEVPGMNVGCFVIEALLKSSLSCFYNQTCLNELTLYVSDRLTANVTPLNASAPSRYSINSTVNELLNEMLIEKWDQFIFYEDYFAGCRPTYCSFTVQIKNNIVTTVTTVISLIGGLVAALELFLPPAVQMIFYLRKRRNRVHPVVFHVNA